MIATERRAGSLELGEQIRRIGEDSFGEIIGIEHLDDDVFLTVSYPARTPALPVDLPVMDADDVVEVLA
jgi:hypothetical protein